ncbi:hypothetical protein [Bacillus sp. JCM 19041]|uniref:hypothetical protein n=1 Tax=Bacillus sp. JCM 19041 TaxID=1460637 RepID=UPI0006CFE2F5
MKVLLVAGGPGWAFDYRAKDLLSCEFAHIQLELKYVNQVKAGDKARYDLIYPMSINIAKKMNRQTGIPYNKMATGITSIRIIDNHTGKETDKTDFIGFLKSFRGVNTASDEIQTKLKPYISIAKTKVGINEQLFKPPHRKKENDRFKVGWVGRIDQKEYRELKGYDLVVAALKDVDVDMTIRTYEAKCPEKRW